MASLRDLMDNYVTLYSDLDWTVAERIQRDHVMARDHWVEVLRADGRTEWICEHGVGHGNHVHGCCAHRCCLREDYPGRKLAGGD